MVSRVLSRQLSGWHNEIDPPLRLFQTVFFREPTTVHATAALSMVSLGRTEHVGGTAGASIWKAGVARGGGTDTLDLSETWNNAVELERCVFITFVLSLRKAAAVGLFTVYIHG